MKPDQAAENLQVIRTLMERSGVYRRALAPIMILNGVVGVGGSIIGCVLKLDKASDFVLLWFACAAIALAGSFLLARRQALKDSEPFWSPPTKRIAEALLPPFLLGLTVGVVLGTRFDSGEGDIQLVLTMLWAWFYGCALYSAGFFMPRGVKRLAWLFLAAGAGVLVCLICSPEFRGFSPHLLMGGAFGSLHLAYGIYLYFTEKRRNEP